MTEDNITFCAKIYEEINHANYKNAANLFDKSGLAYWQLFEYHTSHLSGVATWIPRVAESYGFIMGGM